MARLEEEAREQEVREGKRSPIERAWDRAYALAPAEEIGELGRLCELSQTQEPESLALLETLLGVWELKERILGRVAPSLAAIYRTRRCLLLRELTRLQEEAKQDYEGWRPRYPRGSTPAEAAAELCAEMRRLQGRYYALSTAAVNRHSAVASGFEPITDPAEASQLITEVLAAIDAPGVHPRSL